MEIDIPLVPTLDMRRRARGVIRRDLSRLSWSKLRPVGGSLDVNVHRASFGVIGSAGPFRERGSSHRKDAANDCQ